MVSSRFSFHNCYVDKLKYDVDNAHKVEDIKILALKLKHSHPRGFNFTNALEMVRPKVEGPSPIELKHKHEIKFKT
jgi:hypothetical protein